MEAPGSAEVTENRNSKYWFSEDILYVITKKAPEPTLEETKAQAEDFITKLNGKKICAIIEVTNASPSSRETREYNTTILPKVFKAIAFVSKNPLGRMLANLYLGFKPMPFPVKMFPNESEAKEWIKKYV